MTPRPHGAAYVSEEAMGEREGAIVGGLFFLGSYIAMAAMLTPASTPTASIAAIAIDGSLSAVVGTLLARRIDAKFRDDYANQLRHGGILMWVRVKDDEKRDLATQILTEHSGRDVHTHDWSECATAHSQTVAFCAYLRYLMRRLAFRTKPAYVSYALPACAVLIRKERGNGTDAIPT